MGKDEAQRLRRVRRNARVLIVWTALICSGIPMGWWAIQARSMARSSQDGPVELSHFWSSALFCLITTAIAWLGGAYLIREYLNNRDRTCALMADLRGAVRREDS